MRSVITSSAWLLCLSMALPAVATAQAKAPAPVAGALTLSQAWNLAMQNDPSYQAARSERDAGQANRALGRAGLLPQVNASIMRSKVHGTLETPGACGPECTDLDYMSRINEIRATQTVFNWSRIAEYRQGHARADYSLAVFDTKTDDSSMRLTNRYLQALLARENVVLAEAKLQANEKQVIVAERRFKDGEGIIPEVREALSRRDLARAELIQAEDERVIARRELQEVIGHAPMALAMLKRKFVPYPLTPKGEAQWLAMALANNPEIRAAQQTVRVADHEIDRTFGGHLPSLELVAARRNVDAETISTRLQSSNTTSIGFELSLPIYSGGLVSAQVEQARHMHESQAQTLAATRERVAVEVARQYQAVVTGERRIEALMQAVASSEEALKASETGFQLGARTMVDVLDAEDRVFQAKLDLTQARLEYIAGHLGLAAAAGRLDAATMERISNAYFGGEMAAMVPTRMMAQTGER